MFIVQKKCIPHWSIKNTSYFAASDDKCSAADDVSAAHNTRPNNHAMSPIITIGTGTTVQSKFGKSFLEEEYRRYHRKGSGTFAEGDYKVTIGLFYELNEFGVDSLQGRNVPEVLFSYFT